MIQSYLWNINTVKKIFHTSKTKIILCTGNKIEDIKYKTPESMSQKGRY